MSTWRERLERDASKLSPEKRRELMPKAAAFIDTYRKFFTMDSVSASENGYTFAWSRPIGAKHDDTVER